MKFDELATKIINEYTYNIQSRLAELKGYKPEAQINMLLGDLDNATNPTTKQSIEQALQGFDVELVKRAQAAKAQQQASAGGDVPRVGIPQRSDREKDWMSYHRNA
jgi:hypothetical protein